MCAGAVLCGESLAVLGPCDVCCGKCLAPQRLLVLLGVCVEDVQSTFMIVEDLLGEVGTVGRPVYLVEGRVGECGLGGFVRGRYIPKQHIFVVGFKCEEVAVRNLFVLLVGRLWASLFVLDWNRLLKEGYKFLGIPGF